MLILANSEKNRVYGILQLETLFKEIDSILIQSKKNMECLKRNFDFTYTFRKRLNDFKGNG